MIQQLHVITPAQEAMGRAITMLPYLEGVVIAAVISWAALVWVRIWREWKG
jgi:hypothetical protein